MFVHDILPDLPEALGTCINDRAYRRLSDAVRLLTKKRLFDQVTGELSVCVCGNFITLPPEVHIPLAMQVNATPVIIRNEWFTYHVNGPGDDNFTPFSYADVLGTKFCTIRDPDRPVKLVARINAVSDAQKKLRVYGWAEDGTRIHSTGPSGAKQDGFYVPMIHGQQTIAAGIPPIVKIDRIWKDDTDDHVDLFAVDPANEGVSLSKLGSYRPRENTPAYTRVRVSGNQVMRVKFRRKDDELREEWDWINCDNREALLMAVRAVKFRLEGATDVGNNYEATAARLIKEQAQAEEPGGIAPIQVIVTGADVCAQETDGLYY